MRRAVLAVVLALVTSCSFIYDRERYEPTCESDADCAEVDPLFVCDEGTGLCITCDVDGDGYPTGSADCAALLEERPLDCNDEDPAQSPGNAPQCDPLAMPQQQSCAPEAFSTLNILFDDTVEETGPVRPRLAADPGGTIHAFDVAAFTPELGSVSGPDVVVAFTVGEPESRVARLVELDLDGDYRSREIDPGTVRGGVLDFREMSDVAGVELRTVLVPNEPGGAPAFGAGFGMWGTDTNDDWRIAGGAVLGGPAYLPFASLRRPGPIFGNAVLAQFTSSPLLAPAAVWREPGGTLVRVTALSGEGEEPLYSVSHPGIVPEDTAHMATSIGEIVVGDAVDPNTLFWWDMDSPTVGQGTTDPRAAGAAGRIALGQTVSLDGPAMDGTLGSYLIAYPSGQNIVHQVLACAGSTPESCDLSPSISQDVGVETSHFDMDVFALATLHELDDIQTVTVRILSAGPSVLVPVVTSSDVGGRIEDIRISVSVSPTIGAHIMVALLVTPEGDPNRSQLWVAGARLCGVMPDGPDGMP